MSRTFDAKELNLNIPKSLIHDLQKINPGRSILMILREWMIIAATIYLTVNYWYLYLVSIFVIGARMHALAILMHEAAHVRLFKNRKINDLVCDVFCAWPLLADVGSYRNNHFKHHNYLNTQSDPDWAFKLDRQEFNFPKGKWFFYGEALKYLIGVNTYRDLKQIFSRLGANKKSYGVEYRVARLAFYSFAILLIILSSGFVEFILLWIVPMFTTYLFFMYVRSVAEHFGGMEYNHLLNHSRTTVPNNLEKFFIAPNNVSYHLDHHLYPLVPCHNLPKLHNILMQNPVYKENAHVTYGFIRGFINECPKKLGEYFLKSKITA